MSRPFVYDIGDILIASACLTLAGLAVSILTQQRTSLWQVKKFRLLYSFPVFLILFATNAIIRVITQSYSTMPTAVIIRITSGIMVWVSVVYVIIIYHKLKNLTPREDLESEIILRRNLELELKEREIQLLERTEELEQRNAQLERFAYIASHDLAEPLRKVITFVELLEHKNPNVFVGESGEYLKKIKDANARMGRLMKSILAYSQLTEPEFKPIDLNNLLHAVISDLELLIFDSQAKINILNPLPVIEGAEYQLSQILSNLISNAIKFSKPDELPYVEISSDMVLGKELTESSRVHLNLDIKQLNEEYYFCGFM